MIYSHLFVSLFVVAVISSSSLGADTTTTTAKPTTTTAKPTTTTTPKAQTTTTTPKAKTTSTTPKAQTTSTTSKPTTTLAPATTTAAPKVPTNTFEVKKGVNDTCLKMIAKIEFDIEYEKKNGDKLSVTIPLPAKFTTDGNCGNETEELLIKFYTGWELKYTFKKDGSNAYVSEVFMQYVVDPTHFPDSDEQGIVLNATIQGKKDYMKANSDGYVCKSKISKDNEDVTIKTSDLKYKAFNAKGDIDFKKTGLECSADEDTNSIVPIAVGAALAGLVVIVLIAYLIGRKRTRKTGYESV